MNKTLLEIIGEDLDLDWFWKTVETLPLSKIAKHSRALAIKSRFNLDGSIKNTYQEVANALGINSREQARQMINTTIRLIKRDWSIYKNQPNVFDKIESEGE